LKINLVNSNGEEISIEAELADGFLSRTKGLMGRKNLGEKEGMLFVFDNLAYHSFWMFNTQIPLDAIFFDEKGIVVDIIEMEPCKNALGFGCPNYYPKLPAKYVLEMNKGFAKQAQISVGKSKLKSL